jgi:basic membrane protein A and related proteins
MQIRSSFALGVTTVLLIAACNSTPAATTQPSHAATAAPTATAAAATPTAAAATPTAAAATPSVPTATSSAVAPSPTAETSSPSAPSGTPAAGTWTVAVVTDVGTIDDKNFNQFSYEGAKLGAHNIGAADPAYVVPNDASEYGSDIQSFLDNGANLIVTVGFNLNTDTLKAAKANPNVWFIGVDQNACIDANGDPDSTFACAGDASKVLPNFVGLQYQEDQAGYLAGIVAASISQNNNVAAIGGINLVPAVVRYIQGFELGAKSVSNKTKVETGYVSTSDFTIAFNSPSDGKTYADQFIQQNHPDVVFQVAGKTGNGILESTCANNLYGIGVDVDQWGSLNAAGDPTYGCIVTSAEKHLSASVSDVIQQIYLAKSSADLGLDQFGSLHFNASNDGIGVSPEQDGKGLITPDIQALVDAATTAMQADPPLVTCPDNCGSAQ